MGPIAFKVDAGTLVEPNLHDGRLVGIAILADGVIELSVLDVGGKPYRIVLEEASQFNATQFRQGNIILDITIICANAVAVSDLECLAYEDQDGRSRDTYLQSVHNRVVRESLYVFQLNPSYGCQLIGVAKGVSILGAD